MTLPQFLPFKAPIGAARAVVQRVLQSHKKPMTVQQIYAASLTVTHLGDPSQPLPSHMPAVGAAAPQPPFPPHPEHPVRSMSFLKHTVLPSMLNRKQIVHAKTREPVKRAAASKPSDPRNVRYEYTYTWALAPRRFEPLKGPTAAENAAADRKRALLAAALGLGEDVMHLKRGRRRKRLAEHAKLERVLDAQMHTEKAQAKAAQRDKAHKVLRLKKRVVRFSRAFKKLDRKTRARVQALTAGVPADALPVRRTLTAEESARRMHIMKAVGAKMARKPERLTVAELAQFEALLNRRMKGIRETTRKVRVQRKQIEKAVEKVKRKAEKEARTARADA
ncbi:hypothetical protein K488DRAFT_67095 [Vararia minispora EC-137]|uniref:Uncharacterized protein n=1 Tax=Vararia minispora EC-137 TaxID=1314806 RepID=A0ACB8QZI4_9AGAM|nr:hypothetical protein K488DRAFT_67095 [Vararia minispora EC-137]